MKKIRSIIIIGLLSLTSMFVSSFLYPVYAADVIKGVCDNPNAVERPDFCVNNSSSNTAEQNPIYGPDGILTKVLNILSILVGVTAVIVIMIAGFRYVTSNGDTNTISAAQKTIIYGVIGLVVAVSAQAIVIFVLSRL